VDEGNESLEVECWAGLWIELLECFQCGGVVWHGLHMVSA
jgi:hypothetical protein